MMLGNDVSEGSPLLTPEDEPTHESPSARIGLDEELCEEPVKIQYRKRPLFCPASAEDCQVHAMMLLQAP